MKSAAVICLAILLLSAVTTNAQVFFGGYPRYGYPGFGYPRFGRGGFFGGGGGGRGLAVLGGAALLAGGGSPLVRGIGAAGLLGGLGFF
ncbi:acanthoscurrin-1-like [Ruditapes philippinarum]|uniref:acanthoscurrin-1-like n=1 Tax=Ruditapes philippinarum TaxID=129788 RepID=UPI00295B40F4|nr:acanthoscurrin-1-like [Ruditapes philippinarum]